MSLNVELLCLGAVLLTVSAIVTAQDFELTRTESGSATGGHHRAKRGASVYPVFGSGSPSNSIDSNPKDFIQYLGGPSGSSSGYDGSGGGYFQKSILNSYNLSQFGQDKSGNNKRQQSSGGPLSDYSNAGPIFVPYYGLISPNFGNALGGDDSSTHSGMIKSRMKIF